MHNTTPLTIQLTPEDRDMIVSAIREAKDRARLERNTARRKWLELVELRLELAEFGEDPDTFTDGPHFIPEDFAS
jgi:hypothetical protein